MNASVLQQKRQLTSEGGRGQVTAVVEKNNITVCRIFPEQKSLYVQRAARPESFLCRVGNKGCAAQRTETRLQNDGALQLRTAFALCVHRKSSEEAGGGARGDQKTQPTPAVPWESFQSLSAFFRSGGVPRSAWPRTPRSSLSVWPPSCWWSPPAPGRSSDHLWHPELAAPPPERTGSGG